MGYYGKLKEIYLHQFPLNLLNDIPLAISIMPFWSNSDDNIGRAESVNDEAELLLNLRQSSLMSLEINHKRIFTVEG